MEAKPKRTKRPPKQTLAIRVQPGVKRILEERAEHEGTSVTKLVAPAVERIALGLEPEAAA